MTLLFASIVDSSLGLGNHRKAYSMPTETSRPRIEKERNTPFDAQVSRSELSKKLHLQLHHHSNDFHIRGELLHTSHSWGLAMGRYERTGGVLRGVRKSLGAF